MQNRNVVPNVIRLILSYVQKREKSEKIVKILLTRETGYATDLSSKRYYLFQKMIGSKLNNYVE